MYEKCPVRVPEIDILNLDRKKTKRRARSAPFLLDVMGHMAKAKAKRKAKASSSKGATRGTRNVDVGAIRQTIIRMVGVAASDMVRAAIGEAKKGHATSLKYLFEMAGLYPATLETEQAERREMSLAEMFCRELGLPMRPPDVREKELLAEGQVQPPAESGHAVE